MLVYSTTINEIYTHIHEVIAEEVCRKMIQQLGLKDLFRNHLYFGSEVAGPSRSYNEKRLPILHENAFRCNIKYSTNPFGLKWDSLTPGQHLDPALHNRDWLRSPPIFKDTDHSIELVERYLPCNIELDCSMIFTDRVHAFDVMNRFTATYIRGELIMLNDLSYDYRLPNEVLNRLCKLGQLLELKHGTYMDWLHACSNGQIQRIVSQRQNNRHAEIVVKKHQFESLAAVDYVPDSPEFASLGTSMDTVTLKFTITIQFGRVNMLYLYYPIVVNNHLVPDSMVTVDPQDAYGGFYPLLKQTYTGLDAAYQLQKCLQSHPARNPWYDNWEVPRYSSIKADQCREFFIGVFTLDRDENDCCEACRCPECHKRYTAIDITEGFDQYMLAPDVLKWFQEHPDKALNTESKYSLTVFKGGIQLDPSMLAFDGKILKVPNCKGVREIYRLVIAATTREITPWINTLLVFKFDIVASRK